MKPTGIRSRLVLSPWRLWLMNQVFRFIEGNKQGLGPGAGNMVRYEASRLHHRLFEKDRMRWYLLRINRLIRLRRP